MRAGFLDDREALAVEAGGGGGVLGGGGRDFLVGVGTFLSEVGGGRLKTEPSDLLLRALSGSSLGVPLPSTQQS